MGPSYAQSDAVWAMFGHANSGYITTPAGVLRADQNIDNPPAPNACGSPNACLSTSSSNISRMRMMMFAGCYTALSRRGYILPSVAVHTKGVDSSVGWSSEIYRNELTQWTISFFNHSGLSGYDMLDSSIWAESQVLAVFGGYGGTDKSVWYGNYALSLKPAGYGS
jgi:hypothetical protein